MLLLQVASPKACQRLTILIVYSLISLRAAPKSLNFMLGGLPRQGHTTSDLSGVLPPRLSDANLRRALQHAGLLGAPLFSSPDDMSRALCCHAAVIIFHLSLNVTSFDVCSSFHLFRLSRQYVRAACGGTPCPCPRHSETQVTRRPSTPDNPSTRPIDKE